MKVKNFIIHGINKAQGANAVTLNERTAVLPVDEMVVRFTATAFSLFQRQAPGLLFAGFDDDVSQGLFRTYLSRFHTQKTLGFVEFTARCVHHLATIMKPVNLATGGFLIFAEAEIDAENRLCVLLLNQELKFAVDEKNLTLRDVPALNLQRMGVGCFISLTKWIAGDKEPVAYIRGSREISDYFTRFIGARLAKAPKEASREIAVYAENFLVEKKIVGPEQTDRLKRMYDYCARQHRANEAVELGVLGSIIYQEDEAAFRHEAANRGISAEFHVDERHLKNLYQIEYKTKGVSLRLSRAAVRDNVAIDVKKKELVLRNVDTATLHEIQEALGHAQS